jgi:NitT/TauT family transport system substrate-binding protein
MGTRERTTRGSLLVGLLAGLLTLSAAVTGCRARVEEPPVLIGVRTSNCQSPFFIADKQGLYEKAGVTAEVQLILSNTEIIEAAQRGDLQMGSLPVTTAIAAISRGTDIVIVAGSGRGTDGILTRAEDGFATIGDLRGKKIATIRGSILDVPLRMALEQEGLDPENDVTMVYFSKLGDMISSLKTGQVDATSNTEPFMTEAVRDGWGHILGYYTDQWPDHPCCILFAQREFAEQHPDQLEKILQVHLEAVAYANEHQEENAATIVEYLEAFDEDLVCASLAPEKGRRDAVIRADEIMRMAGYMLKYDMIDQLPSEEKLVDLSHLERAREALE